MIKDCDQVLGAGNQIRHYTYGGDLASGIRLCIAKPFAYVSDDPFKYDVQKRVPCVDKAKRSLGFSADTSLDQILDEVMPWIVEQIKLGGI